MSDFRLRPILLPTIAVIVLLVLWQYGIQWLEVPAYLVPTPLAVLAALKRGLIDGVLWPDIAMTFSALMIGYIVGCTAALIVAGAVSEYAPIDETLYPLIVAFQSVPKVALAPVLTVWFGFDMASKVVMVALICFFPCFVNAVIGLKSCNPNLVDLYRAFGAGRRQIFFAVKLPSAINSIFAGLEISFVLAMLGAVIAEFVAARRGLGHAIAASMVDFNVAMMFACIVILSAIGVIGSQLITIARRRIAFWDQGNATSVTV